MKIGSVGMATIIGLAALGFQGSVRAGESVLRLEDVLTEVRENSPRIQAAAKMSEAARARVPQAKALDDPILSIENQPGDEQMVGVEQMIPFPWKLKARATVAEAESDSVDRMSDRTVLEILVEAKHAFHHLFHWHKKVEINLENQDILQRFVRIAESRYLIGRAGQEDVLKAQVEAGKLANELVMLNRMKGEEEANLSRLMNRSMVAPLPPPESLHVMENHGLREDDLYALAEENRQETRSQVSMVRAGEEKARLARLDYAPDFLVGAEWGRMEGTLGPAGKRWGAMLGLSLPVWFTQKQRYGVREADAMLQSSRSDLQDVRNRVRFEVKQAYLNVTASNAQLDIFNSGLLPQAEQDLRITTSAYEAGKMDFLRLLESQRALRELKIAYFDALLEYNMSLGDLELAVGKELPIHTGSH
ncbi:MAG: TolC family protein [Nitrospirae bacterium]|nr:TolC family protein [Nitrospirota bacterium]